MNRVAAAYLVPVGIAATALSAGCGAQQPKNFESWLASQPGAAQRVAKAIEHCTETSLTNYKTEFLFNQSPAEEGPVVWAKLDTCLQPVLKGIDPAMSSAQEGRVFSDIYPPLVDAAKTTPWNTVTWARSIAVETAEGSAASVVHDLS